MEITKKQIKELDPCKDGWDWYLKNQESDLKTLLLKVNESRPDWARWLFTNLMDKTQCVKLAIFAASEVLPIFEGKYPDDARPRKAIKAAIAWVENPTEGNRKAAYAAVYAAVSAADADAAAADAAYAAVSAAVSAADAADAADTADTAYAAAVSAADAADAAYAAYADCAYPARKVLQEKIIREAVRILEATNG